MRHLAVLIPIALSTTGCLKMVGGVTGDFTSNNLIPELMQGGDIGVACAAGESLGSMVSVLAPKSKKAQAASILPSLSAGMCLEDGAREAQLAAIRAFQNRDVPASRDHKTRAERLHAVAATRYYDAYLRAETFYGVPEPGGECPKLKTDVDELSYMLAMSAGVMAILHDANSGNAVGVPLDIPARIGRASVCLDDDKWWGVPTALQAVPWALLPDTPGAKDAWQVFDESVAKGDTAGVRLASAFQVEIALTTGNPDRAKAAIAHMADSLRNNPADPQWKMLDVYSADRVLYISDLMWTEEEGYRTPGQGFGTFPAAPVEEEPLPPLDDLFPEDLLEEEAATEAPAP